VVKVGKAGRARRGMPRGEVVRRRPQGMTRRGGGWARRRRRKRHSEHWGTQTGRADRVVGRQDACGSERRETSVRPDVLIAKKWKLSTCMYVGP
jgi:hypothetical protein